MYFKQNLIPGELLKRYKRFLADVRLKNGEVITAHCPNSGSMKSCQNPGWPVLLSESKKKNRKYKYTWEMIHNGTCWIGINTAVPNQICTEAIQEGKIKELNGYSSVQREKRYGKNSRIDILLESGEERCYVEVKNVTLVEEDGNYYFPDAVTERGTKHLFELTEMVRHGHRAVMFYVIQRNDGMFFKTANHIDTKYSQALEECYKKGVEVLVYRADVTPEKIIISEPVEWMRS